MILRLLSEVQSEQNLHTVFTICIQTFTLCIQTDRSEQTVQTLIRCHRMQHLIRIYTVCYTSKILQTQQKAAKLTCSNFRSSMVKNYDVQILRANMLKHNVTMRTYQNSLRFMNEQGNEAETAITKRLQRILINL